MLMLALKLMLKDKGGKQSCDYGFMYKKHVLLL